MSLDTILGYSFTIALTTSLGILFASVILGRKEIRKELKGLNKYSLLALLFILASFLFVALVYVTQFEELYFDENIYQGIAINILKHGTMLWCLMGTGYLDSCYSNTLYHDPVGWSYFIAIFFAIFGISTDTAYMAELFIATLGIILFFLFSYLLSKSNIIAIISTAVLAFMPEFLIWSRTQADPDLPFMTFSIMSFMFFLIFMRRRSATTLAMFLSSLAITLYTRTEAILLVGTFFLLAILLDSRNFSDIKSRFYKIVNIILNNAKFATLILFFFLIIVPQIIYIGVEASNPQYGQPSNQSVISIANFKHNFRQNVNYLLGYYNFQSFFPAVFPISATLLAIIGSILIILQKKPNLLLVPLLWLLTYLLFYSSFYAGSALFGVDSRFMLQLVPSISFLAGAAIVFLSYYITLLSNKLYKKIKHSKMAMMKSRMLSFALIAVFFLAFVVYPFKDLFPLISLNPEAMPQQEIIAPAMQFFYMNYSKVPSNCLVFSFTPDIWYEVGRASMQIGYLGSKNVTIQSIERNFSCYVLDYGYWCLVPPYNSTLCLYDKNTYLTVPLSEASIPYTNKHPAFYLIENYTP
ncbi:MAG: ArnT family glycosyltransferase [Candidatus Micrarchaeia archaeon]